MTSKLKQPRILMYHGTVVMDSVSTVNRAVGAEIYDIPVEQFRQQMEYLKENNYNVITLRDKKPPFGPKDVVLTFDDGEMNNFQYAYPVLKKLGMTAYFFVIAKKIGKEGYMGMNELKQLIAGGMIVGSHSLSHEIMTNLLDTQIEEELRASKKYLESHLGGTVVDFSVPRGFCNDKIIRMAYDRGYENVFISQRSRRVHEECLSRISVRKHWTMKRLEQGLVGHVPLAEKIIDECKAGAKFVLRESGYNWVRDLIIKIIK